MICGIYCFHSSDVIGRQ